MYLLYEQIDDARDESIITAVMPVSSSSSSSSCSYPQKVPTSCSMKTMTKPITAAPAVEEQEKEVARTIQPYHDTISSKAVKIMHAKEVG